MTPIALIIQACGLSHREAAEFLDVRIDTVKSWSAGRNPTPEGAIDSLRDLHKKIERAAAEQIALIEDLALKHGSPDIVDLALSSDDTGARRRGWPCVGAQAAAYAIVVSRSTGQFRITSTKKE